jgi:hypothetical protein
MMATMNANQSTLVLIAGATGLIIFTVMLLGLSQFDTLLTGAATLDVAVDEAPPSVVISRIDPGPVVDGRLTVTVTYVVTDASDLAYCVMKLDNAVVDSEFDVPRNTQEILVTNQPPGIYNGEISCTDDFGNTGGHTFTMTITEEDVAPPTSTETQTCGNSVREGTEQCDGADFSGQTCITLGMQSGSLGCNSDCTYNTVNCGAAPSDITLPEIQPPAETRFNVIGFTILVAIAIGIAIGALVIRSMTRKTRLPAQGKMLGHRKELSEYIKYASSRGATHDQIYQELVLKGWPTTTISDAFKEAGL